MGTEVTKAASPYVNIGCQCSPLTFVDQYGTVQGNCRSADSTGARWCYVDSAHSSSCQDLRFSARFPNNPWSYEACATPPPPAYVGTPLLHLLPSLLQSTHIPPPITLSMADTKVVTKEFPTLELFSHMVNLSPSLPTLYPLLLLMMLSSSK